VRLQRDLRDLPLGLLGARVERRRQAGCGLGILAPVPDELALALGPLRELMRRVRDRLRGRLELARGRGELARHRRKRAALAADFADDVRDRGCGAVHAHPEEPELIGGGRSPRRSPSGA